jgi:hypothetical protein
MINSDINELHLVQSLDCGAYHHYYTLTALNTTVKRWLMLKTLLQTGAQDIHCYPSDKQSGLTNQNVKKDMGNTVLLCKDCLQGNECLNSAVYEIIWENIVEPGKPKMTIFALHTGYLRLQIHTNNTEYFSTATMASRTRLNITLHVLSLFCCVCFHYFNFRNSWLIVTKLGINFVLSPALYCLISQRQ